MNSLFLNYLPTLASLAGINMLALISPGPDFAVVLRNSLLYSRKTAILTAAGIAFGCLIHVSYTLFGLGLVIQKNPWLFLSVQYAGGAYLFYIGFKGLYAKRETSHIDTTKNSQDISAPRAFWSGFLTNALNPKCMLFFISLLSSLIAPNTPILVCLSYGGVFFVQTFLWFSFVALCLSGQQMRLKFYRMRHWIERIIGVILMMLGIKIFFAS